MFKVYLFKVHYSFLAALNLIESLGIRYFSYNSCVEEYGGNFSQTYMFCSEASLGEPYGMGGGDHCAVWGCDNDRRYPQW